MTLSRRISEELGVELGQEVGFSVRFEEKRTEKTQIHFVTDGMAIREMMLNKTYQVFILDEAHERSVNTDVLLAILKRKLAKNHKMRLIIMSATIEVNRFLSFFDSDAVRHRICSTLQSKGAHLRSEYTTPLSRWLTTCVEQ